MIKYDDFILERMWNGSRKLTEGQFWKIYNENCQNFNDKIKILKNFDKPLKDNNFLIIDNIKERRSSMMSNYYTLMINNLESWKNYPKRQQICSLNGAFNLERSAHRVIPFDNSKWGVCTTGDIWYMSFLGGEIGIINKHLFRHTDVRDDKWENFLKDIKNLKGDGFLILKNKIRNNFNFFEKIETPNDILQFFIKEFNPQTLGFELNNYENLPFSDDEYDKREIWTDSPCLYVSNEQYYNNILPKILKI